MISLSIQDIQQNPQTISNFYLANIQQALTDPKPLNISLLPSPPTFSPPATAVWVNSLWFFSLAINVTCSVLATLQQRWARRYIMATQPHSGPHKQLRTRAFYARGVERFVPNLMFATLPILLHLSFFLFAAGLVVYLWHLNPILSKIVAFWLAVCLFAYYFFTASPLKYHGSPYDTPLSLPVWSLKYRILCFILWILRQFTFLNTNSRIQYLERYYRQLLSQGMLRSANKTARKAPLEIDTAFLNDLNEIHDMEHFFSNLPTFQGSKPADYHVFTKKKKAEQLKKFIGYLDSTFSSDIISEIIKGQRAFIYTTALDPAELPDAYQSILDGVLSGDHHKGLKSAEFGRFMRGWSDGGDGTSASVVQAICSGIVAKARRRDDSWFAFASDEMVILEPGLRAYAAHGKSLSLAILFTSLASNLAISGTRLGLRPSSRKFSKRLPNSRYKIRCLNSSTSSVLSGMKSFSKRGLTTIGRSRVIS
jgi:hypothetical protein